MQDPTVEVLGVHPVIGVESCCLVEAVVIGAPSKPDFGRFTQPLPDRPPADWQVPYDERLLDAAGTTVEADLWSSTSVAWPPTARIAFFFHALDLSQPLHTPYGQVVLPPLTPRPDRLHVLSYEAP
jgi:hypothetical protein